MKIEIINAHPSVLVNVEKSDRIIRMNISHYDNRYGWYTKLHFVGAGKDFFHIYRVYPDNYDDLCIDAQLSITHMEIKLTFDSAYSFYETFYTREKESESFLILGSIYYDKEITLTNDEGFIDAPAWVNKDRDWLMCFCEGTEANL